MMTRREEIARAAYSAMCSGSWDELFPLTKEPYLAIADAILALPPLPAQGGWVTVPREPNNAMLKAALIADGNWRDMGFHYASPTAHYKAMIASAPPPPVSDDVKSEREACAKVAAEYGPEHSIAYQIGHEIAATIRARKP